MTFQSLLTYKWWCFMLQLPWDQILYSINASVVGLAEVSVDQVWKKICCFAMHIVLLSVSSNSVVTPVLYPCYDVGVGGKVIWIRNVSFNVSNEVLLLNIIWTKWQFFKKKTSAFSLKKQSLYLLLTCNCSNLELRESKVKSADGTLLP